MDTRESSNGLTAPNAPRSDADRYCLIRTFASSALEPRTAGRTYVSAATFASQQRPFRPPDVLRCCVLPANFVVRSKANPESEERDFDAWASAWSQTSYRKGPA